MKFLAALCILLMTCIVAGNTHNLQNTDGFNIVNTLGDDVAVNYTDKNDCCKTASVEHCLPTENNIVCMCTVNEDGSCAYFNAFCFPTKDVCTTLEDYERLKARYAELLEGMDAMAKEITSLHELLYPYQKHRILYEIDATADYMLSIKRGPHEEQSSIHQFIKKNSLPIGIAIFIVYQSVRALIRNRHETPHPDPIPPQHEPQAAQ